MNMFQKYGNWSEDVKPESWDFPQILPINYIYINDVKMLMQKALDGLLSNSVNSVVVIVP